MKARVFVFISNACEVRAPADVDRPDFGRQGR